MARIRTIKPEFPQSESMGRVSRDARLLFLMLWTICDDEGRTRAASRMLASVLFPYDEDAPKLIDGWLDELEREKCVRRYRLDGTSYLEICNWLKHQKIDKPSRSKIPSFDEASRGVAKALEGSSLDLDLDLDQGRDQEGTEGEGSSASPPAPPPADDSSKRGKDSTRGTRLPEGWSPDPQLVAEMRAECAGVDLRLETAKFRDYWKGVSGSKGVKLDWPATWRNWIRRAFQDLQKRGGGRGGGRVGDSGGYLDGTRSELNDWMHGELGEKVG
jgi:hypothetical protein